MDYTTRIAQRLSVKGLINIQFVVEKDDVYIIEVNPRSSRTVPYMSKITCIPMVNVATKIALGANLPDLGYEGDWHNRICIVSSVPSPNYEWWNLPWVLK